MTCSDIEQVRGIEDELKALADRLRALTCGNPAIHNDQFILARGQINSAIRLIEQGVLRSGGVAARGEE